MYMWKSTPLGEDDHCWNWLIHWHINVEKLHVPMQSMPEILWRYVTYCCWIVFNTSQSVICVLILPLAVEQAFVTFGDSPFFSEQCYLLLQILFRIIYWFLKISPWAPISVLCESFYMDSFSLWFLFRRLLIVTFVIFVYFSCIYFVVLPLLYLSFASTFRQFLSLYSCRASPKRNKLKPFYVYWSQTSFRDHMVTTLVGQTDLKVSGQSFMS